MISATVALAVVLASIVAARSLLGRRDRTGDRLKLGSVSQQWLLVHKGEDR